MAYETLALQERNPVHRGPDVVNQNLEKDDLG